MKLFAASADTGICMGVTPQWRNPCVSPNFLELDCGSLSVSSCRVFLPQNLLLSGGLYPVSCCVVLDLIGLTGYRKAH